MSAQTKQSDDSAFLRHSLTIGTIAETKVRLHWTFLAFLVWLAIASLLSDGLDAALSGTIFMVAVFACVLAHEFGHILTARHFGIPSPDVTLLPIGGIARMQAFPERPGQGLAVALAGPAVNLAIAAVLILLGIKPSAVHHAVALRPDSVLPALVSINLALAVFNLLPAFPMDGGRALRAILAYFTDRTRATRIAAGIGQTVAIGLGLLGLFAGNVLLIFIAMFVFLAAGAENRDVQVEGLARHMRVADATVSGLQSLPVTSTLDDAVRMLLQTEQRDIPVVDDNGQLAGVLTRDRIIHGLHEHGTSWPVSEAMLTSLARVSADSPLNESIEMLDQTRQPLVVVDGNGSFVGLLNRENLGDLLVLAEFATRKPQGRLAEDATIGLRPSARPA